MTDLQGDVDRSSSAIQLALAPVSTTLELPGVVLQFSLQPERAFAIRAGDWKRMKKRLESMRSPLRWLEACAWTATGIAASGLMSWIAWLGTEAQFTQSLQQQFVYIGPILIVGAAATSGIAIVMFVLHALTRRRNMADLDVLIDEFEALIHGNL